MSALNFSDSPELTTLSDSLPPPDWSFLENSVTPTVPEGYSSACDLAIRGHVISQQGGRALAGLMSTAKYGKHGMLYEITDCWPAVSVDAANPFKPPSTYGLDQEH